MKNIGSAARASPLDRRINRMLNASAQRDPIKYAKVFARRNPQDDGFTDGLVKSLARLFSRAQLTSATRELAERRPSKAARRQYDLLQRARRITYLPLNKRWT
jgi:hypothetical protein